MDTDTIIQILIFGGLIFVMMRFGCGSHMKGHGSKDKKGSSSGGCCGGDKEKTPEAKTDATGDDDHPIWVQPENDRDPVCSKMVSKREAKTSVHDNLAYYFCSTECREAFEASPSRFLNQEKEALPGKLDIKPAESGNKG